MSTNNKFQLGHVYKIIEDNKFDYFRLDSMIKEAVCIDLISGIELPFVVRGNTFYMDYNLGSKLEAREFSSRYADVVASNPSSIEYREFDRVESGAHYHISYKRPKTGQIVDYFVRVERMDALLLFVNRGDDPGYEHFMVRFNKSTGKFTNDDTEQEVFIESVTEGTEVGLPTVVYPVEKTRTVVRPTAGLTEEQLKVHFADFMSKLRSDGWSVYTIASGTKLQDRHFIPKVVFGFLGKASVNGVVHSFKKSIKAVVEYIYDWFYFTLNRDPTKTFKKTNFLKQVSAYINNSKANALVKAVSESTSEASGEASGAASGTASKVSKVSGTVSEASASNSAASRRPKVEGVFVETYSGSSIAVFGNTKEHKDSLKALGGRFNPNLTWQGKKTPGWIFPIKTRRAIEELFGLDASPELKLEAQAVKDRVRRFLKSKIGTGQLQMIRIDNKVIGVEYLDNDQIYSMWNRPHPVSKKTLPEFTMNKGVVFEYLFTWYKFNRRGQFVSLSNLLKDYSDYEAGESSTVDYSNIKSSTPSSSAPSSFAPSSATPSSLQSKAVQERRDALIAKFEAWMHRVQYPELKRLLLENIDNIEFWRRQPSEGATEEEQLAIEYLRKFYKKLKEIK